MNPSFPLQELSSERVQAQKLSSQVTHLNQSLEELENKLKTVTSQLELQTELAKAASQVTATPSEVTEQNNQTAAHEEKPENSFSTVDEKLHLSETKTLEKEPQTLDSRESLGLVSERLTNVEKEVCIRFITYSTFSKLLK